MLKQISLGFQRIFCPEAFAFLVVALVAAAAAVLITIHLADVPEVYVSHSTNECVEVKDPAAEAAGQASEWSCSNLPTRYEQVWTY